MVIYVGDWADAAANIYIDVRRHWLDVKAWAEDISYELSLVKDDSENISLLFCYICYNYTESLLL